MSNQAQLVHSIPDFSFKFLVLGESGVGKTCIILRYTNNEFLCNQLSTIGVDLKIKYISIQTKALKILIWDTAGEERFRNITSQYYNGSDGIILVYDVNSRDSFNKVSFWVTQINQKINVDKVGIILVGNKIDIKKREVSKEEGEICAKSYGIDYIETSALTNFNINECFDKVVKQIFSKRNIEINEGNLLNGVIKGIKLNSNKRNRFDDYCSC